MSVQQKIDNRNVEDIIALTPVQEGMLFHYLNKPSSELYFEQMSFRLTGRINIEAIKKAWDFVAETNGMLRSVFRWGHLEKPIQIILKKYSIPIKEFDFSDMSEDIRAESLTGLKEKDRKDKIDIGTHPFRIMLCKLKENEYEMILSNHHIVFDGWSIGIILKEFLEAYRCFSANRIPAAITKNKYKEFVKWVGSIDKQKVNDYWSSCLGDFTAKTALPEDVKNQAVDAKAENYDCMLDKDTTSKVREFSVTRNISVASLLYSAWGILLQRYNDNKDVVFGTTVSGRPPELKGVENIVGLFINTPPIRIKSVNTDRVLDYVRNVDTMLRDREEYELTPLTDIKACSGIKGKEYLFDSIVVIENYPLDMALKNYDAQINISLSSMFEMTNYDLTLIISTLDDISIRFIYDANKYHLETIKRLSSQYTNIIESLVENPLGLVEEVDMLSKQDKDLILFDFNNTEDIYPKEKSIVELFEAQVEKTPDNTAVIFESKSLTYKELNEKANQLARVLIKNGVGKEKVVGIMLERSLDLAVALLAILKTGGAYLPIDLNLPAERVLYMLEDSGAVALITNSPDLKDISFTKLQNFEANKDLQIIITSPRGHIKDFDSLPVPDRSLIDISRYKGKIGMASVNNCISLQTTRGCPYKCIYCHKVWSKFHVHRTAENIFNEMEYYYKNGVTNFAVIDDCFNLDVRNSRELFELILKNNMKVQLFFPNGLRGDILTPDYIDLMVEAGTRGINLSLETASPRLQKLLKKDLDLDKFKDVVNYIASKHSNIVLELATMHGFPTETEEEAIMTLNFIKDIKWLHFPYIHILKIFPNTEMEQLALEHGISKEAILISKDRAFHELPETLPFPKSFTRKYQADFMNEYFLSRERLKQVLPVQLNILDEEAVIQKYNAYLPTEIRSIEDITKFAEIQELELPRNIASKGNEAITIFDWKNTISRKTPAGKKVLFLDLSQHFSSHSMLYNVVEQPIGQIYLLTYLKKKFGDEIDGRIYKSGNDFDSFEELKVLVDEYKPDVIGIRTLTYFKEFFHETVSLLRQWGLDVPIIAGGPYASSDYDTILQDKNVDIIIFGEGEYTLAELIEKMLQNRFRLPSKDVLSEIKGIAFADGSLAGDKTRNVILLDRMHDFLEGQDKSNPTIDIKSDNLAYVMYTSGSTGRPKGVMVEHKQVNNCIFWMQKEFKLTRGDMVVQRTNLTFDPSVWELFWPLYTGATVKILTTEQSRDAQYLVKLMSEEKGLTVMYCPASLVTGMTYYLNSLEVKPKLNIPWLVIGAEPISMDTIKSFYSYFEGKIVNTYGPTECTINNTYIQLDRQDERTVVPIGRPVSNNRMYILSKDRKLMPLNAVGEIYIAGDSLARGYINNPEKTKESFLDNPFGAGILYKTGDLGCWKQDGTIEIMGRVDEQLKIRGYRIELGEIEAQLLKNPSIKECVAAVKDNKKNQKEIKVCEKCGITSAYPGVTIDEDSTCDICRDFSLYKKYSDEYFKKLDDLKEIIKQSNRDKKSKYDCILMYKGEKSSAFALYTLLGMGFKVLTLTCDNGYFTKSDLENIKRITGKLGVDNIVLKHQDTGSILKESIKSAHTVCRGCTHIASSLALEFADKNDIKIVIGASFSRGQIIENKLMKFYKQGIFDAAEIERELQILQKSTAEMEKNIFDLINIDVIRDKSAYDKVQSLDFYRYCDITNEEMLAFLKEQNEYRENGENYALYLANCPIKQLGDLCHINDTGYHYYGSAASWEKRLGHMTLENLREDLSLKASQKALDNFLKGISYEKDNKIDEIETKYLCAYYVSDRELDVNDLRENISKELPDYMIPSYFVRLDSIPLTVNGKIDRNKLPEPDKATAASREYDAPTNEIEASLAEIWSKVLGLERVGINDNFFNIGGNSILLIKMHSKIEKKYSGKVTMADLFAYTTVAKLAELIGKDSEPAGKDIKLKRVEFPGEYFLESADSGEGAVFKVQLQDSISERIKKIAQHQGCSAYDVLVGMYGYLIAEITEKKEITIQTMVSKDKINQLHLDLTQLTGFEDLFKAAGKADTEAYSEKELECIAGDKRKTEIVPFIYANNVLVKRSRLLEVYDIAVEIDSDEDMGQVYITCAYDAVRLRKEKMKEFMSGYLSLLKGITEQYEFE